MGDAKQVATNGDDVAEDLAQPDVYRVFLSHATADKFMARMVDEKLEGAGFNTFRDDRDIDGGDRITEEIRQEIVGSNELVVIWTAQSIQSDWVKQEIGAAWGLGLRITALLHVVEADSLPPTIRDCKAYPINDLERYIEEAGRRKDGEGK